MKGLEFRFTSELSSATSRFQREDFQRRIARKANEAKERFDAVSAINTRLKQIESGDTFGWWELNLAFLADEKGRLVEELKSDLTSTKVWSVLDASTQRRVIATAKDFLTYASLPALSWLGTNTFHRPAAAAYRAFRLLLKLEKDQFFRLPTTVWKVWGASIFVSSNDDNEEDRMVIVQRAYELAPEVMCRAIARVLLKGKSDFAVRHIARLFDRVFDERLGELLWRLIDRISGDKLIEEIVFFLASKEFPKINQLLIRRMEDGLQSGPTLTDQQFIAGISGLLSANPQRAWQRLIAVRARREDLALEIIRAVARNSRFYDSFIPRLGETELADFYTWTYKVVPPRSDEHASGFSLVGPDEQVDHLRGAALTRLVSLGTPAALAAVQRIAAELPEVAWLKYQVLDARRAVDANTWKLRDPSELIATIALYSPAQSPRSTKAAITSAATEALEDGARLGSTLANEVGFQETIELPLTNSPVTPRKILAVATEWRSGHGGISTFNRELCTALAKLGHEVACLVISVTEQEISDAKVANVRLIAPPSDPGTSPEEPLILLLFYKEQLAPFVPEVVIGHDHITGLAGHHIARRVYDIPYVHFVHTLPEEIEKYKTRSPRSWLRGGVKSGIQTQQCKTAQLVVAVGPRIYSDFCSRLGWVGTPVVEIHPGLSHKLTKHTADLSKPRRADCLLVARLEDPVLKGAPLACQIITQLNSAQSWHPPSRRPKLILRGFTQDAFEAQLDAIDGMEAAKEFVSCRPYTAEEDDIASDICAASVVIMPSKHEGFGLTALEAIAAGIPIVITSESGLGEFLLNKELPTIDAIAARCVADVIGPVDEITSNWSNRVAEIFNNPKSAFDDAAKLRSVLLPVLTWERAARSFSKEIEVLFKAS